MLAQASEFRTFLHEWPASIKFIGLVALTIILVLIDNLGLQIALFLTLALLCRTLGVKFFKYWLGNLKPLLFFVLVIAIWNIWRGNLEEGAVIVFRLLTAVGAANLFSMTTRLDDFLALAMKLASPLSVLGVNPKIIALSIALTLRFIPILRQKSGYLQESWRARSRKRANWKIVVPMVLLALDDASQISDSLRARGGITPEKDGK